MKTTATTEEFVSKAIKVHGTDYTYDKTVYKKAIEKVKITCNTCKNLFLQQPNNHLSGQGCPSCKGTQRTKESLGTLTRNLPYVFDFSEYTNGQSLIPVYCKRHNSTEYRRVSHIRSRKTYCTACTKEKNGSTRKNKQLGEFLRKSALVHGDAFDYSGVVYEKMTTPVRIACKVCNLVFKQVPHNHSRGAGCPECGKNSQGWSADRFKDKPTTLYVLDLGASRYKVGITSRSVEVRYRGENTPYKVTFQLVFKDGADAWYAEKQILQKFRQSSYKGPSVLKRTGNREIITDNPVNYIEGLFKWQPKSTLNTMRAVV